jgi:hypothetical protein
MAKKQTKSATKGFKILKKSNGRFAVAKRCGGFINGEEKIKILLAEGKISQPKKKSAE